MTNPQIVVPAGARVSNEVMNANSDTAHSPVITGSDAASSPMPTMIRVLARIEGQVRGVARMVDDDRYCIDVLTQIAAVTRALQEVALGLAGDHLRHCVIDAARSDPGAG
jgi:DNA-binding FrmR family transcriptional regulator